jgi:LmbE family N-acetylglucosaminyl deacetylase
MTSRLNFIKPKTPAFFISPHLDDAIFSAGGLISFLSPKTTVKVINVFTLASPQSPTLSARTFLRQCGFSDATGLYRQRRNEDEIALSHLRIIPLNLGFTEAMWRFTGNIFGKIIPELGAVYPTYRWHVISGRISHKDFRLMDQLLNYLKKIIPVSATVFCPIGNGNHVDHLIVREVCTQLPNQVIYWSDFPYDRKNPPDQKFILKHHLKEQELKLELKSKLKLMHLYESQFPAVFSKGLASLPAEKFYL